MKKIVEENLIEKIKENSIVENIVFKSTSYNRNYDFGTKYDSNVTTIQGYINYIQTSIHRPTMPIGEYMYNVFNLKLAKKLGVNFMNLLDEWCETNEIYNDFIDLIKTKSIDFNSYNKVVYVSTFILNDKFKDKEVTKEFINYIENEFYGQNVLILFLVKPFQTIKDDFNYFLTEKTIEVKTYQVIDEFVEFEANLTQINNKSKHKITIYKIPALRYYNLNGEIFSSDEEIAQYKLYAHAMNLGLERIKESNIFKLNIGE